MDKRLYWLWLQAGLGFGANTNALLASFGNARNIYETGTRDLRLSGAFSEGFFGLGPRGFKRLETVNIEAGKRIIEYCDKNYISIITPDDPLYPQKLLKIQNYPLALFVKGDISCLNASALSLGVIGTRKPSEYGIKAAKQIACGLAKNGTVIVSGGALGIDSIAHKSAIEENAKTVLVMGCGHDSKYLSENAPLREEVTRHGATITEYPPFTASGKGYFPLRNRIISGVSDGVVIVEANLKSGTLNTAAHAKKQQRDIFAVPGDVSSVSYAGSNKLIIDGAHAVFSAADILERYKFEIAGRQEFLFGEPKVPFEGIDVFPLGKSEKSKPDESVKTEQTKKAFPKEKEENPKKLKTELQSVSKNASLVYNVMKFGCSSLDEIIRKSALPVRSVLIALTELEIGGAVACTGGNNYELRI
ncbi:MAG: DNA-processing protein DprA [Clostridia bacterium]|nr:DNA-processing protein DprA [Clostridia bacterium]